MKEIKVVEIINSLNHRAGAEVFFSNLCCCLNDKVKLTVVTLYSNNDLSLVKQMEEHGINILSCDKRSRFDFKAAKKLKKILNDINPDIINFHLSFYTTYFLAFKLKRKKWKLLKTYHSVPSAISKIDSFFEKKYLKKGLLDIVGISDLISSAIKNIYNENIGNIYTIYNGIKLPKIDANKEDKIYNFIIVASMTPVKNHTLLFDAFNIFIKNNPNAKLLCVGGGSLLEDHKQYCKNIGISNNVEFTGPVEDVSEYLLKSKTLILSSKYEGNPICVLEAMSYGLQVIAPRVGGIPDIIKDKENGFLFNVNDKEQLINCLEVANSGTLSELIKNNNLNKIQNYSIEMCAQNYVDVFEKVANKK